MSYAISTSISVLLKVSLLLVHNYVIIASKKDPRGDGGIVLGAATDFNGVSEVYKQIFDRSGEGNMRFETERLILRDYEESDNAAYFKLKSDPKTMYYLQDIQLFSRQESDAEFANVLQDQKSKDRKFYFFHIELKDSHEQVGSVGYTVHGNAPVGKLVGAGYFTFPQYWNHGYVTEAFKKVIEFAFLENNVYRITTGCLAENVGSERVMQKCGLIKEAEHVDWEWHQDKMKTRLEYRLLKNEWPN